MSRVPQQGSAGSEKVDAKSHLDVQAVLNTSVQLQRARILVPAIAQGLTRRPAARDLHVQGAPVFVQGRHGTQHRAREFALLSACSPARVLRVPLLPCRTALREGRPWHSRHARWPAPNIARRRTENGRTSNGGFSDR